MKITQGKNGMKITQGKNGLTKSWQTDFPEETPCVHCDGTARIGFVAHEGLDEDDKDKPETRLYNMYKDDWLHDCCAVAVYFCKACLETSSLYNQG